jgi:hypothetical protein
VVPYEVTVPYQEWSAGMSRFLLTVSAENRASLSTNASQMK